DYARSGVYIQQKNVSKRQAEVRIQSKVETQEERPQDVVVETQILNAEGKQATKTTAKEKISPQGITTVNQSLTVKRPHLWQGVEDPYLYSVVTKITQNGKVLDEITEPLGLRHIEIKASDGV